MSTWEALEQQLRTDDPKWVEEFTNASATLSAIQSVLPPGMGIVFEDPEDETTTE